MSFLEFLKVLLPDSLIKFQNCGNTTHIHIDNSIKDSVIYNKENDTLILNPTKFEENKKIELNKKLIEFTRKKENKLQLREVFLTLEKIVEYLNSNKNQGLVSFFENIIPKEDLKILKTAFFVIDENNENTEINKFKNQIRTRFGDKGVRIVNLTKAGYFNFLKDLYNEDKTLFEDFYNCLVVEGFLTIFVHSKTDILNEVLLKINQIKKNKVRFNFLYLHAIGNHNIKKINEFLKIKHDDYITKESLIKDNIAVVGIYPN